MCLCLASGPYGRQWRKVWYHFAMHWCSTVYWNHILYCNSLFSLQKYFLLVEKTRKLFSQIELYNINCSNEFDLHKKDFTWKCIWRKYTGGQKSELRLSCLPIVVFFVTQVLNTINTISINQQQKRYTYNTCVYLSIGHTCSDVNRKYQ